MIRRDWHQSLVNVVGYVVIRRDWHQSLVSDVGYVVIRRDWHQSLVSAALKMQATGKQVHLT